MQQQLKQGRLPSEDAQRKGGEERGYQELLEAPPTTPRDARGSRGPPNHPGSGQVLTSKLTLKDTRIFWSLVWVGLSRGARWVQNSLAPVRCRGGSSFATPILQMKKLSFKEDRSTALVLQLWSVSRET